MHRAYWCGLICSGMTILRSCPNITYLFRFVLILDVLIDNKSKAIDSKDLGVFWHYCPVVWLVASRGDCKQKLGGLFYELMWLICCDENASNGRVSQIDTNNYQTSLLSISSFKVNFNTLLSSQVNRFTDLHHSCYSFCIVLMQQGFEINLREHWRIKCYILHLGSGGGSQPGL